MKTSTTSRLLAITLAAFASFGAQADEADASQFATQFQTQRTRAEVQAEAATVAQTRSIEPAGSRVAHYQSTADRAASALRELLRDDVDTVVVAHGTLLRLGIEAVTGHQCSRLSNGDVVLLEGSEALGYTARWLTE